VILVTVGTNETPFDRLLRAAGTLVDLDELVVQYGSSDLRLDGARCVDFLPFDQLTELVASARVVVTHAGAGSVLVCLAVGKRPVVMPRLHAFGEAVDDHQLIFARQLAGAGLLTVVDDGAELEEAVREANGGERALRGADALAADLSSYLRESLGAG
jgi:UDP-N-acetylglucosamine transferase subunit ALG13